MKNSKTFIDLGTPLFILLILLFTLSIFVGATDYCDPDLCAEIGKNLKHTACNHTGEFHPRCMQPFYVVPISPSMKKIILHVHNDLRNKVANGTLPGFQSATRMPTLLWDSELAYVVELHLKSCLMQHDDCRNTDSFRYVGQNLGEELGNVILDNEIESIITKLTFQWFDEFAFAKQSDMDMCCDFNRGGPEIYHFAQLIHQKAVRVGCAITRYDKMYDGVRLNTVYYGCNYSFANLNDLPIYEKGPAASGCQSGVSPEYNALCSVYEEVNQWPDFLNPQDVFFDQNLTQKRPIFSQFQPDSKAPTASRPAQPGNLMDALGKVKTIRRTKPMIKPWELTGADNQAYNEPPNIPVPTIPRKEPPVRPVTIQHVPKRYEEVQAPQKVERGRSPTNAIPYGNQNEFGPPLRRTQAVNKPSWVTQPARPNVNAPTSSGYQAYHAPVPKFGVQPPETKKPSYRPPTKPSHYGNQNELEPPRYRTQINVPSLVPRPAVHVPTSYGHYATATRNNVQPPETRKPPFHPSAKPSGQFDEDDDAPPPLPMAAIPKQSGRGHNVYNVVGTRPMPPSLQPKPYSSGTQAYRTTRAFPYAYGNANAIPERRQSQDRGSIRTPKQINPPTLMGPGQSGPSRATGYRPTNTTPSANQKRIYVENLGVADIRSVPHSNAGRNDATMGMLPMDFDDEPQGRTCAWKPSGPK